MELLALLARPLPCLHARALDLEAQLLARLLDFELEVLSGALLYCNADASLVLEADL